MLIKLGVLPWPVGGVEIPPSIDPKFLFGILKDLDSKMISYASSKNFILSKLFAFWRWFYGTTAKIGIRIKISTLKALYALKGQTYIHKKDDPTPVVLTKKEKKKKIKAALKAAAERLEDMSNSLNTRVAVLVETVDAETNETTIPRKNVELRLVDTVADDVAAGVATVEAFSDDSDEEEPTVIIDFNDFEKLVLSQPEIISNPADIISKEDVAESVFSPAAMNNAKALRVAKQRESKAKQRETRLKDQVLTDSVNGLKPKPSPIQSKKGKHFKDIASFVNYLQWDPKAFQIRLAELRKTHVFDKGREVLEQINARPIYFRSLFPEYMLESYLSTVYGAMPKVTLRESLSSKQEVYNRALQARRNGIRKALLNGPTFKTGGALTGSAKPYSTSVDVDMTEYNGPGKPKLVNKNLRYVYNSEAQKVLLPEITVGTAIGATNSGPPEGYEEKFPRLSAFNEAKASLGALVDTLRGNTVPLNPNAKEFVLPTSSSVLLEDTTLENPFDKYERPAWYDIYEKAQSSIHKQHIMSCFSIIAETSADKDKVPAYLQGLVSSSTIEPLIIQLDELEEEEPIAGDDEDD